MKQFNPVNRPIQPSYTLDVLSNSYSTMEQGHKEAIQAASELQTAMASLDLNEAEDEFRQAKINEIKQTIDDNLTFGNAYQALPQLIAKAGDIASDPQMTGRLKAQKDFKAYQEQLEKNKDIPEHYKEYYKEKNQYHYADKVNDKGQIIGGTKWEANETPVEAIDMNTVLRAAAQYVSPDSGGNTVITFIDADGNRSKEYKPGSTVDVFNTRTQQWEKVTDDKLMSGLQAAMRADPKIRASLEQDFKIANWQYDKDGIARNIFNGDGTRKTINEYVESIADPWIKAKRYNNFIAKDDINEKLFKESASKDESIPINLDNNNLTMQHGKNTIVTDKTKQNAFATVQKVNGVIRNEISKILPNADPNLFNVNDIPKMEATLQEQGVAQEDIDNIITKAKALKNTSKEEARNYKKISDEADPKGLAAIQMLTSLETGMPVDPELYKDNPAAEKIHREYTALHSSYFDPENGGEALIQPCTNKATLRKFIEKMGGETKLASYGIEINYDAAGDAEIYIPATIGSKFGEYCKAFSEAYGETNMLQKAGNMGKRLFGYGNRARRVYSDGHEETLGMLDQNSANNAARTNAGAIVGSAGTATKLNPIIAAVSLGTSLDVSPSELYGPVLTFQRRMSDVSKMAIGESEKTVETVYAVGGSYKQAVLNELSKYVTDPKVIDLIKKNNTFDMDLQISHLYQLGTSNAGVMVYNQKKGMYTNLDDNDLDDLNKYVQNSEKTEKAQGRIEFDPTAGLFTYAYTVPVKDGDAPKDFKITDFKDERLEALNSIPELAGIAATTRSFLNDYELYLGNNGTSDMYAQPVTDESGERYFNVVFDDNSPATVLNVNQVQNIKGVQKRIEYLAKRVGSDSPEFVEAYNRFILATGGILSDDPEKLKEFFINTWNDYANK